MKWPRTPAALISMFFLLFMCVNAFALTVNTNDIADGAVTTPKISDGAVTASKIVDGVVSDAKISGPISASKIQGGIFQNKYANVIVVAKSGGDYTDPVSAMNSISNASASNPYLVKIMPGVYTINTSVQMKAYVDIEGSGQNTTKITGNLAGIAYYVTGAANAEIRNLTIEGAGTAIYVNNSPQFRVSKVTITLLTDTAGYWSNYGIDAWDANTTVDLSDTTIKVTGFSGQWDQLAVHNVYATTVMQNVTLSASGGATNEAIGNLGGSVTIKDSSIYDAPLAIVNSAGGVAFLINTRINGSIVNYGNIVKCVGLYDANYTFYANTCP